MRVAFVLACCTICSCGKRFCPEGSDLVRREILGGVERYCENDRRERVGPYHFETEHVALRGTYREGKPEGEWLWDANPLAIADERNGYIWLRMMHYAEGRAVDQSEKLLHLRNGHEESWLGVGKHRYKYMEAEWDCGMRKSYREWSQFDGEEVPPPLPYYEIPKDRSECLAARVKLAEYLQAHPFPAAP